MDAFPDVQYPRLSVWNTPRGDDRLRIINQDDFPLGDILKSLGLERHPLRDTFGVADETEVNKRLALVRALMENEEFRTWCQKHAVPRGLPTEENGFLRYYSSESAHNPLWTMVHEFVAYVNRMPNPPKQLRQIATVLQQGVGLEDHERAMAAQIKKLLESVSSLAGLMRFDVSLRERSDKERLAGGSAYRVDELRLTAGSVFGHRMFRESVAVLEGLPYPSWTERNRWYNKLGIGLLGKLWFNVQRFFRSLSAYEGMAITEVTDSMVTDVSDAIERQLDRVQWNTDELNEGSVGVYFSYDKDGLKVQILGLHTRVGDAGASFPHQVKSFEGYSSREARRRRAAETEFAEAMEAVGRELRDMQLRAQLETALPGFFTTKSRAASPEMDREFMWYVIPNLYAREYRDVVARVEAHRTFFAEHLSTIALVADLVEKIAQKARELAVPLTTPEVVGDQHVVSCTDLVPAQLLFRLERGRAIPINGLPEMNGRMVCLTGAHGGGKTESSIAVAVALYMAQSGLPVFASQFRFNVKRVLGMVFIAERGVGSTCQQLVEKLARVLKEIKSEDGKHVVLVLDEVGTGTQEASGLELGRDVLQALAKRGVSVVFSTQITSLAQYAEADLNAICVQFDDLHRVKPGIGDGGMNRLRERSGLNQLLEV